MLRNKQKRRGLCRAVLWEMLRKNGRQIHFFRFARRFCCFSIGIYQHCIAPLLPPMCRFYPSCSAYAKAAFAQYGLRKGILLTLRRLLRCRPWGSSGYDPLL